MDELVERTLEGDDDAWRALWLAVEPTLWAITASWRFTSQLSKDEDERRNIVVRIMEQLRADDFRRLRLYRTSLEHREHGSFPAWLATVAARSAISYLRAHPEYLGCAGLGERTRWARLVPVSEEDAESWVEPIHAIEAGLLWEKACGYLPGEQLSALLLWLEGWNHVEIACQLELADDAAADRMIRAALWRLRDRLIEDDGGSCATLCPSGSMSKGVRRGESRRFLAARTGRRAG